MHKQPESTARTRQKFVDAFCTLYRQKPIEKITVQELAVLAGYNRSTFYEYFSDIYAVRDYAEDDVLRCMEDVLPADGGNFYDEKTVIRNAMLLFEEKKSCLDALLGDYGSIRFQNRLKERFPLHPIPFQISRDDPRFPYLTEFHVSAVLSILRLWLKRGQDLSSAELFELIYQLSSGALERASGLEGAETGMFR